jgi:hypothetical protein
VRCVFAANQLRCESQIAIAGSLILTKGDAHTALKIIGGAGRFLHATGMPPAPSPARSPATASTPP